MQMRLALAIAVTPACAPMDPPASLQSDLALYDHCAEVVSRHDSTTAVARCQVAPIEEAWSASVVYDPRVERSAETVTKARLTIAGDRKTYEVGQTSAGLEVRESNGTVRPTDGDERARRVSALAAAVVGWRGKGAAAHPGVADTSALAEAVKAIVDLRLHGEPAMATASVRFKHARREAWGDALVFDVDIQGASSSSGMCHRWTSEAHPTGELVLRASDGALAALRLRGPMGDTEALCPEGAKEAGVSPEPRACNRGETNFDLSWKCDSPG
jgi:hypothetical protein